MIRWIKMLSFVALGLVLQAESCSEYTENQSVTQKLIDPPFQEKNLNIQPQTLTLVATQGGQFDFPNGTQISVPKDCFVDAAGNPIQGNIKLNYREFHTPAQILASGIKMTYDSAGQTQYFESAGMFDIQGVDANENPVFIAEDKKIDLQMASFVAGNYNSYKLNENTKNWEFITQTTPTTNFIKQAKLDEKVPASLRPIEPQEIDPKAFAFELKTDLSKYPELREMEGVMFQFAGKDETQNPENKQNAWIWEKKWGDVGLQCIDREHGLFKLEIKTDTQQFETIIRPVLRGKELEKARQLFAQKMQEFEAAKIQRLTESKRLAHEADLLRKFEVRGFGTHNFDVVMPMNRRLNFVAEFDFGKEIDLDKNEISIFMIPQTNGSAVVRFMPQHWNNFWILTDTPTKFLAILPNQEVAVLSQKEFEKLDKTKIQANGKAKLTLEILPEPIKNMDDLTQIIAKL